jgi:adenylate cyclase
LVMSTEEMLGYLSEQHSVQPLFGGAMHELLRNDWAGERFSRRLAAIAFLDVVGYSRLMSVDEDATLHEWSTLRRNIIEPRVRLWRGRVVDRAGDGLFIEFHSALDAFRWAVEVQSTIAPSTNTGGPLKVRIALHLGDVMDGPDGEVQGDGVNTASRLQSYAEPGGVIVSQALANEVIGKTDAVFSDLGELRLKNIARPIRAFRLTSAAGVGARCSPSAANGSESSLDPWAIYAVVHRSLKYPAVWVTGSLGLALGAVAMLSLPLLEPAAGNRQGEATDLQRPGAHAAAPVPSLQLTPAVSSSAALGAAALRTPSASRREEALRLLREGRAIRCPEHPCPREWLAARAIFEQAIAVDPDYAPPYADAAFTYTNFVSSGLSLNEKEDLRAAERLATRAAALAPDRAFAHEARAAVLRQDPDRLEDALAAYLRSLSIDPKQPSVRANAGWMLVLLGRPAEAEPYLRSALAEAPEHGRAAAWLTYLGLAELFLGREGHGADSFLQALARQSTGAAVAETGLQRGLSFAAALALSGKIDEAKRIVEELRQQHAALSTRSLTLWNCRCSKEAGFVAGQERLRQGMVLAGVADIR